jgi:HAD superfamily hydrolase (TIGR01509 family)
MFDAVIFDWDGTLADTKRAVVESFQKVLRKIGCEVSDEFIARRIGIGARNTFRDALKVTTTTFDDEMLDELVRKKVEAQMDLTANINLFDGALDLLNSLYGKVKIALATMNNRRVIDKLFGERGIRKYFDVVITVEDVLQPKPNPEIFLECAKKLECRPEKCVVIEDSVFGVKAAKEAKMQCIAIPTGAYSREELEDHEPDLLVNSIAEREKILNFILG